MGDHLPLPSWGALSTAAPTAETLTAVEAADRGRLSPSQLLDALRCCERLLSHVAGLQMTLLAEFARPGRSGDISRIVQATAEAGGLAHRSDGQVDTDILAAVVTDHAHGMAAAELSAALDIAPVTARRRVEAAVDLHEGLPRTLQALTDGVLDRGRAALIAECTSTLEPEPRLDVEDSILPMVGGRTAGRLRPLIERAVLVADPETRKKHIEKARRGREVTHLPLKDQLSQIKAVLPADGAVTVFTLIDLMAGATKAADDDRSVAERRADALTDLATELLTHGQLDLRGLLEPGTAASEGDGVNDDSNTELAGGNSWYDEEGMPVDEPDQLDGNSGSVLQGNGSRIREASEDHDRAHSTPEFSTDNACGAGAACLGSSERPSGQALSGHDRLTGSPSNSVLGTQSTSGSATATPAKLRTRQGRRPHLTVTMSLSTLMALDELPAHLEGYGAITAELATAIAAAAASVSIAVVDPHTGAAQHASARFGYRPSQKQRDIVTTLAATCRFPSCRQPAWRCDLDHRSAYDHEAPHTGGPTCPCNLDPHCRRHHLMKHHSDWTARRLPDGAMVWKSPTGHRYTDAPTELTLPGELLTRIDGHPAITGAADAEHREQCAEPVWREDPVPVAMKVHLAQRRALHAHVLERIRSVRQARLSTDEFGAAASASVRHESDAVSEKPSAPSWPPTSAFVRTVVPDAPAVTNRTVLDAIRQRALEANAADVPADDALPPF